MVDSVELIGTKGCVTV